jgi:glyoxylate/hydroxypyruvate reductase A
MTRIVLLSVGYDMTPVVRPLLKAAPELVIVPEQEGSADVAVCWNPRPGSLARLRGLKLVHSIAAGVDNILADPALPAVPLCRVVDPGHAQGMTEFVTWGVLHFHRQMDRVLRNHARRVWERPLQVAAAQRTIGVMGLGTLGARVAGELRRFGFSVRGYSRTRKALPGVETFGEDELKHFLSPLDILVCLLPLTEATRGILNREHLAAMPRGARLIHAGRGEHLVRDDVLGALNEGQLGGAIIDVFDKEPLSPGDAFWQAPNLIVTPHMASMASFECIGEQVASNVRRLVRGEPLANQVDAVRGY